MCSKFKNLFSLFCFLANPSNRFQREAAAKVINSRTADIACACGNKDLINNVKQACGFEVLKGESLLFVLSTLVLELAVVEFTR